jgi:hypothetical protein
MDRPRAVRTVRAWVGVLVATTVGVVVLSGSGQPVTAQSYPHWQQLPAPPMAPRTHALGIRAGHQVLVLGGSRAGAPALRGGASYDLRTGRWQRRQAPIAVSDRDIAVDTAGVVVLRHTTATGSYSWWRYAVRQNTWSRLRHLPPDLHAPSAFASEVYALSGHRVVVYSVQLDRWTPLAADPRRPLLRHATVTASRSGTVVTGSTRAHPHRLLTDRWDGLRWRRGPAAQPRPVTAPADGSTRVRVDGRTFVMQGGRAWIRLP